MKLLYIAANPYDQKELDFSPEITEIQRRAVAATSIDFIVFPSLRFEDLPSTLHYHKPDVLHIASHGTQNSLVLANKDNKSVKLDAEMLLTFISDVSPPRLVYLNACDSIEIAKTLTKIVPVVIGSTAPVTGKSARTAAVSFYDRIFEGSSVDRAFAVCKQMMRGATDGAAGLEICVQAGVKAAELVLHTEPQFIAEFIDEHPKLNKDGEFEIRFGVRGCPPTTKQVVFFTDDPDSVNDDATLENDLCSVVREPPQRGGLIMMDEEDAWDIEGDLRLYAVGVSGDGQSFTVSTFLCDALDRRYRLSHGLNVPADVISAINHLRMNDGSQLL